MVDRILVTGGAGFLGWHLCRRILEERPGTSLTVLDAFTYAASRRGVRELRARSGGRLEVLEGDVADADRVRAGLAGADAVIHLAAESHVDRSIEAAAPFVRTNVVGTQVLLDAVRRAGTPRVVHVSTDEVYGHLERNATGDERFAEDAPLRPRSPYAASKAAADHLVLAAVATHRLPAVIVRPCNAWGAGQYPEKLIPVAIRSALEGRPVPLYGDGLQVREWVHAEDHARGIMAALERGVAGEVYNLGGGESLSNRQVAGLVLRACGAPADRIEFVADRPGHDQRYALEGRRAASELGWVPERRLEQGLPATVEWYRENASTWWS
jgi:dTDP-glucose 4,6-dehydratase